MKKIAIALLALILILIFATLIPIKKAVYVNEKNKKVEYENSVYQWFHGDKKADYDIVEITKVPEKAYLKLSGTSYIGEHDEYYDIPVYFQAKWNSPLWWLNTNFDPQKVKNYFGIKYYSVNGDVPAELKDGYYEKSVVIIDWTPIYPIRRSGWLASRLLPDDRLVIWDFIGWRACW